MIKVSAPYALYGLALQCPLALPCPRTAPTRKPDVRLNPGSAARFARARKIAGRPRSWYHSCDLPDGSTYLCWTRIFEFIVSADGHRIFYRRLAQATRESLSVYLLGQVLSFSLLAFGRDPLHGTVVVVDGGAVALVGDTGFGKSTLAAAFLARGYRVLVDDLVVLEKRDEEWLVHPGLPRLKLFPAVARGLLGPGTSGARMIPGSPKLVVHLDAKQSVRKKVPLKAIYLLSDPSVAGAGTADRITIDALSKGDAFPELIRAAFNLQVLGRRRQTNQFQFAADVVAGVPVRRLRYPRDLSRLSDVCDAVLADLPSARKP